MLQIQQNRNIRRKPTDHEHCLQVSMVQWFRLKYPTLIHNLFAIPNGGRRDAVTGARLKAEGQLAGVSDLILLKANRFYHGLLIEVKTKVGRQSEKQKDWGQKIANDGFKYIVVRSLDEFITEITNYIKDE